MISTLRAALSQLLKHISHLPETLAQALKERQLRRIRIDQEAERLDRIRNPSKYRGK